MINTGPQTNTEGNVNFKLEPSGGNSFGAVIRKGISKQISIETGINITRRNFDLTINEDSTNFQGTSGFKYIIYEIPILGLVYVQLGEKTFLNTAFGLSLNFLPSDWESFDYYFEHYSARRSWVVPSLLANIGFEYRTYDKGFFYVGISYNRPFTEITTAGVLYKVDQDVQETTFFEVSGNYLTIDLRYFFNEPTKNRNRR